MKSNGDPMFDLSVGPAVAMRRMDDTNRGGGMDVLFAEKFIDQFQAKIDYDFFITNREGIILAATEKERVGVFHEASFVMMRDGIEMITVYPEEMTHYLGAKPGIDLPLLQDKITVGAVGMTGNPDVVLPIVSAIRVAIEALLECELLREKTARRNTDKEKFFNLLLSDKHTKNDDLVSAAKHFGYRVDAFRVAILVSVEGSETRAFSLLAHHDMFSSQDIAFAGKNHEIVVFHHIKGNTEYIMSTYRQLMEEYVDRIRKKLAEYGIPAHYYIGTIQKQLNTYSFAYRHCRWMKDNQQMDSFFFDHILDYFKAQIPILELSGVFHAIADLFDKEMTENYLEIIGLLEKNNYNLVATSNELYIHKNTLVFRLNKIRDFLGMNPFQNACDRTFMGCLHYFMGTQNSSALVPEESLSPQTLGKMRKRKRVE